MTDKDKAEIKSEIRRATRRIVGAILLAGDLADSENGLRYFDDDMDIMNSVLAKDVQAVLDTEEQLHDEAEEIEKLKGP